MTSASETVQGDPAAVGRVVKAPPISSAPVEVTWQRAFPGEVSQLSPMRQWLKLLLPESPSLSDVLTVATELATNAVCHTRSGHSGWFTLTITWTPAVIRVAVTDLGGSNVPALREDADGIHGRGLVVVRGLSRRTGVLGDGNGRQVWAEIACDDLAWVRSATSGGPAINSRAAS